MNEFKQLAEANRARQQEWDPMKRITLVYRGNELAGEVGEACNEVKKIERERLGIRGSRTTREKAAEELADVVICASLIALDLEIDLWPAIVAKFNKTSEQVGLKVKLEAEAK
jgi:NTP pyrophosphatase (non-canonical NTP hydrolase)